MNELSPLASEEDIRTKIVTTWLVDHGFSLSDISVEYSFEIRLGRKVLSAPLDPPTPSSCCVFRPRADILVRSSDGRNLLIVEAKAADEPLGDDIKEQGICYARLLRKGGIAPFVILTNGHETKIYDSITEELISDRAVPLQHPYVKAGFRVNVDDLALRAEILERFIALSPENLIAFCCQQVEYRMRFLKDENPYSGKKYIPSLYIERPVARQQLVKLLDEQNRQVIVVVGPPQVGKTNFICHMVEERLEQGVPCLFYPAIGMGRGLLEAMCEDFEWILRDGSSVYQIIHHKLQRILNRAQQKLLLFIDGWNEADLALARTLDRESERLAGHDITCVISMTDVAARRLLQDEAGNPSHIAEAAAIHVADIPRLAMGVREPERPQKRSRKSNDEWSVMHIEKYNPQEMQDAYRRYASIFHVQVPGLAREGDMQRGWNTGEHMFTEDPFLLRIAMEQFQGKVLPRTLDEPDLLAKNIELKSSRAGDLREICVSELLSLLADEMFSSGAPTRQSVAMKRWRLPLTSEPPKGLFEAALLAKVQDAQNVPALDFYYGRERDFAIACWARNWTSTLKGTQEAVIEELSLAAQTSVGLEALRWFLKQPAHKAMLQSVVRFFPLYSNSHVNEAILSSVGDVITSNNDDPNWIQDFMVKLLEIKDEDKDLLGESVEQIVYNLHLGGGGQDDNGSKISRILENLLDHPSHFIHLAAANLLGDIAPDIFLAWLGKKIKASKGNMPQIRAEEYAKGVELAANQYGERYYGSFCPGYLEGLKQDAKFGQEGQDGLYEEYTKMFKLCEPIIAFYPAEDFSRRLKRLLEDLYPVQRDTQGLTAKDSVAQQMALRYQLPLPFDDFDIERKGN